jgi:energy-coupling factor transport system ATP-binding protein
MSDIKYETIKEFIKVENLYFKYKKNDTLKDINLTLDNSQFVSMIGSNGSGKTTLGKLITGILKPYKGNIYVDNKNVSDLRLADIGKKIGYLFQNPSRQIFATDVYDELTFAMKFNKVDKKVIDEKVEKIIEDFDLNKIRDSKCHTLSQGEKQRLALGTLLLNDPEYLILDEPTTGLDMKRKENLSNILNHINSQGVGILMISHDMEFVKKHSNRIIELNDGRIVDDKKY